ncbi:MAG: autotransporter-associated beta strand repeat-containing protein [Luteolibacter sp.]|uniref:rhamnogalacturonan lyase family protein n=1 Tax=Luteolibacter sp. TaxID=1962973 RepID=UPI0032634D4C
MHSSIRSLAFLLLALVFSFTTAYGQRQMEKLGRGVVAIRTSTSSSSTVYIGWRLLGNDPEDVAFNVYRSANGAAAVKITATPITATTNYTDTPPSINTTEYVYSVRTVLNNVEVADTWSNLASGSFKLQPLRANTTAAQQYVPVAMQPTPDDAAAGVSYDVKFCWVGDVDGDGNYDFIVDRSNPNIEAKQWLQAYKMKYDGTGSTLLWQMDMGPNSIDHYNITPGSSSIGIGHGDNVTVYDLDGDGKAEVIVRTANGVVFANGTTLTAPDNEVQYISIIDGLSGAEKARATVPIPAAWPTKTHVNGQMGIVYADGIRPSIFFHPSNRNPDQSFNKDAVTWDYRNGVLTQRWLWQESGHTAEAHGIRLADVDNDGKDEYVDIGNVVKSDGSGQINENVLTEVVHGDRFHVTDIDPDRPGLETYLIQQNNGNGLATAYHAADKSSVIKKWYAGDVVDVGRGTVGAFVPNLQGLQFFSTQPGVFDCKGNQIYADGPFPPETIWWDGDLGREFLSTIGSSATSPGIDKFNTTTGDTGRVLSLYSDTAAPNSPYNNYIAYGGRPQFWGDILGDWREEMICAATDNSELRIYTTKTTDVAKTSGGAPFRIYTLMHNPQYRIQTTTKGYVQSSYVDYYLGYNMTPPPPPPMVDAKLVWKGGAGTSTWDGGTTASWLNNGASSSYADGDTVRFDISGNNTTAVTLVGTLQPGALTVYNPSDYTFTGAGTFAGTMKMTKAGAGALVLPNTHTFTGKTTVWDGALVVNGNLQNSPVTVWGGTWGGALAAGKTGGRIAGTGQFSQLVTIKYRGAITPGTGMNNAGTLTCAGGLAAEDGATFALDLSDDPTGVTKANDRIAITGSLTLTGTVKIVINPLNTKLAAGTYTLATYTGPLTGGLANLAVVVPVGTPYTLSASGGLINLTVPVTRAVAAVTWRGVGGNWDLSASQTWLKSGSPDVFVSGDTVTFDTTGAASPTATLTTVLPVAGVTVNSSTDYTFGGAGCIDGTGGLTKSGTCTLTINTANTYTGPTVVNGGVLAVSALGDAGSPSAIGASAAAASNFILNGGTLRLTGLQTNMNRNSTLGASGGTFDITSSIQISGAIGGSGSLAKVGTGTLLLASANTYTGGTVINGGKIYLAGTAANTSGLGTGTVTINNGTLSMADVQASETAAWNILVPAGATARLEADGRCSLTGSLTGSGDFTYFTPYVRSDLKGNWSAFTGQINVTGVGGGSGCDFRIANSFGFANAAIDLGSDIYAYYNLTMGSNLTLAIGELSGSAVASSLSGGPSSGKTLTWQIGGKNTDSSYAGMIKNSTGPTALTKVGTGTLTLAPATTISSTTVSASTAATLASTSALRVGMFVTGSGIPAGTTIAAIPNATTITLSAAATVSGTANLIYRFGHSYTGATTVSAGKLVLTDAILAGTNVTVASAAGFGGTGSITGNVSFSTGSVLLVNPAAGPLAITGNLTLSGAVTVSPLSGAILTAGTYPLCTYTGTLTGTPSLSWLGQGYNATFNTSVAGVVSMTLVDIARPPGDIVWSGATSTDWDTSTLNWTWTGGATRFLTDDRVRFDDTSAVTTITYADSLSPASVTVASVQNYTLSGAGAISGAATLTKSGSGTLTLASSANNYTGITTISGGTLILGSNVSFGTGGIGTGGITFEGGTLSHAYATGNTLTYSNTLFVDAGQSGAISTPNRFRLNGAVSGAGTLNMTIATTVSRADFQNSFTGFSGNFNLTGTGSIRVGINSLGSSQPLFDATGWANTTLGVDGVTVSPTVTSAKTILIGALTSTGNAGTLGAGSGAKATYSVGAKNLATTYAGKISGANAALTKTGSAALTLAGANDYTGATTVSAGSLLVTGSLGATAVTVATAAKLGGSGTIGGAVTCNGTLAPGASIGTLTLTSGLTFASTSTLDFELGTSSDKAAVTGNLTLDGTVNVTAATGFTAGTYTLVSYTGTLTNNTLIVGTLPVGYTATVNTATAGQVKLVVVSTNTAPQISAGPAASPASVITTTTSLSVTATDNAGEGNLVYSWTSTGPASLAFSPNGTNAAKISTATFTAPGSYTLTLTVTDAGGLTATTGTPVTVIATPTTVSISPPNTTLAVDQTQTFAATVRDQFATPVANPPVTWSASGGGTIHPSGLYTATVTGGPWQVTATSGALSANANVTVTPRLFANWETSHFTPAQILAGESAPTADPDHDGLTNLAEYALGSLPYAFTPQPTVSRTATNITITFQRPAYIGDVAYQAEAGDLGTWEQLTPEVLNPGSDPETVRATKTLGAPAPTRQFMRLRFVK